jgi:hypothetical protein
MMREYLIDPRPVITSPHRKTTACGREVEPIAISASAGLASSATESMLVPSTNDGPVSDAGHRYNILLVDTASASTAI